MVWDKLIRSTTLDRISFLSYQAISCIDEVLAVNGKISGARLIRWFIIGILKILVSSWGKKISFST